MNKTVNMHLQLLKLLDKLWAEDIHSGAELLPNLDEGRPQFHQPFPHPNC